MREEPGCTRGSDAHVTRSSDPEGVPRPAGAGGCPAQGESAWSRRYTNAAKRYAGLDLCSKAAAGAVIEGLREWAGLVPQRSVGADGKPEPANTWGLGAERSVLRAIHSHLVAVGQPLLAARIRSEMADLLQTAEALDECYVRQPPDPHSEARLVATARIQTKALVKLLSAIRLECSHAAEGDRAPPRKRGAPCRHDPAKDRRLMEQWAQVRGRAGMTRKEFCALKRISLSLQELVQAQDRLRKRSTGKAGDFV